MNTKLKRILAILLSLILILSMAGCSLLEGFDSDALIDGAKDKIDQAVDDAKDKLNQAVDDAIQDAADSAKDKLDQWLSGDNAEHSDTIGDSKLSITMLNVGQGLSVLVESDGEYLLYDGGDRGTSSYVVSYLNKHGVEKLDYMIASHYDSDHIAGLVGVLEKFDVENVINPATKATTKIYESYINGVENSGAEVIYPSVGDTYELGDATITVLAPAKDYGDSNEMSVAIKISCDSFDCIITGDAESKSEADMLKSGINLNAELYVVGHHGSSSSNSDAFVKAIDPDYAFISCGKDNDYGHPHKETLDTLDKYDVEIYRSDKDGEVTCVFDGDNYTFED